MTGTLLRGKRKGGGNHSSSNPSVLSRPRQSVRCRKTCIQRILLQSPVDNDEKASHMPPSASSLVPHSYAVAQE